MFKKLSEYFLFNNSEISTNITENNDINNTNKNETSNNILEDKSFDEQNKEQELNKCNHDWVDYDVIRLKNISKEIEAKRDSQLNRILKKLHRTDELDNKILDLLVKWYPASPMVYGKCMCCSKQVVVMYLTENRHTIFI